MKQVSHFHVIKDPVHGTMQFSTQEDHWIKPFINSLQFQRLRHIKQLGFGDLIFPGAVHTRFNHSVGCCYVASQIAHKINLDEKQTQLVMLSCLLHDIGHGPFSHAFEEVFRDKAIKHEDWTPYFLSEYRQVDFIQQYNKENPEYPLSESILDDIENMIMHKTPSNYLLADIVSSQLDADRLDYLLRDSHFCGVNYGEYDFKWMLHAMTRVKCNGGERLGITHKGIGIAEQYLMARRLMMRNIYHNQKKYAIEILLIKLFQALAVEIERDASLNILKHTSLGKFLICVNQFNQSSQSKKDFLSETYALYKNLYDYDVFLIIRQLANMSGSHDVFELARRLHQRQIPKVYRLNARQFKSAEKEIKTIKKRHTNTIRDWQILLIETPHQSYTDVQDPILVDNGRTVESLSQMSLMIDALSDKLEYAGFIALDQDILDTDAAKDVLELLSN